MKMKLKNKNYKKMKQLNIKFTSKNLFLFLISFSILAFILGIIFFCILNDTDKINSINSMISTLKVNENYLSNFRNIFLENSFTIFLIWVLGLSVIGIIIIIFIYFCNMFALGFNIAGIFYKFKIKGIYTSLCYLFPSKLLYLIVLFLLTFFSIKISYKFIKLCFSNNDINIKREIRRYFKVLIFSFILIILISFLKVFIDPIFINLGVV